jgi:hypothetical protein
MKQHAENLAKRLLTEFRDIESLDCDNLQKILKKVEVATILVQELQTHVIRYKLIQTEADQINFFKNGLPLIQKWLYANEFIYKIEREALLGTQDMKIAYYKEALQKLNYSYKKRTNEFACVRQNDREFEKATLHSQSLNNDIVSVYQAYLIAEEYLIKKINQLKSSEALDTINQNTTSGLKWMKSKTDLVELCYALFYSNCIIDLSTQKPIQLTKLTSTLQITFSTELKDYKRLFSDVKKRKLNETFTAYLKNTIQYQIDLHFK